MCSMRSFINKAFAFIALLSVLPAFNSPQITDVFVDPYTNGLLYTLYSEQKVDIDNVSSWMSPHGWYYITVNGATFSLEIPGKIPAVNQIKDIVIKIPSDDTQRIQEGHLLTEHILCEMLESSL